MTGAGMSMDADRGLLEEAERAMAGHGLPAAPGGFRRHQLLAWDALSTCWSGWDLATGAPVWLSILRPRWLGHPAMLRRFWESPVAAGTRCFSPHRNGELPLRTVIRPGTTLRELTPLSGEDEVSLPLRASILAHGLQGLAGLHQQKRGVGGSVRDWLVVAPEGPRLIDRHAFCAAFDPAHELMELAASVVALAPNARDPIATLARAWCERPPPSAEDAGELASRAMATHLAWLRHELVRTRRSRIRGDRLGRLSRLIRRLDRVQHPPVGEACLAVGPDGQLVRVWSDGQTLRGGRSVAGAGEALPVIWSAEEGLDPVACRLLIRGWSQRDGRCAQTAAAQAALGERATDPTLFIRWLKASRRLRSARLLLDAEARVRVVR